MRAVETLARFRRDERGAILIFFALALVVILGFAALAFDLGRTASTQTELQSYADNLALAAAGELDGDTNARQRARDAAAQIAADYANNGRFNDLTFLTVDLSEYNLTFYSRIPSDDADDLDPAHIAEGDPDARYVAVEVEPQGVGLTVMRAFDALRGEERDDPAVGATAVAAYRQLACDITPMFFCTPENEDWRAEDNIGQMFRLRNSGGDSWSPGNFGFLTPSEEFEVGGPCEGLDGANLRRCFLGAERPAGTCFAQRGVNTSTGGQQGIARGINTRFDHYQGSIRSDDPLYPPAPNVIQGDMRRMIGDDNSHGSTMKLPRDSCFPDDDSENQNCPGDQRFGNGDISLDTLYEYFARNHGKSDGSYQLPMLNAPDIARRAHDPATDDELDADGRDLGDFYDQNAKDNIANWLFQLRQQGRAPRYEIYLSEIDNQEFPTDPNSGNLLNFSVNPDFDSDDFGHKTETGRAENAPAWSTDPDRRVLIAAGIDCKTHEDELKGQSGEDIPVDEFVRLFITEPVGAPNDPSIYVEVIGSARATGAVRDLVELVR